MIPTGPAMIRSASHTHAPRWRVTTSDGQDWTRFLLGGSITRSAGVSPRSRCTLTLAESGAPSGIDQGFLPSGRDVQIRYRVANGTTEILVFTGRVVASALTRTQSTWSMEAVDHSAAVAVDLIRPGGVTVPPKVADLVRALVLRTLPTTTFTITGPALTANVPAGVEIDGDPWQIIEGLCQGCGSEAYFDPSGVCIIRPEPVIAAPVDALRVGPNGVITGYEIAHEAAYSRVEIHYEDQSDPPVSVLGVWQDTRADSPTSVARIGRVTLREDHGNLLGLPPQAAADSAAAALAGRLAGRGRRSTVRHIPRPWIEPGDTIEVTLAGGPTEAQMVDSVEIPLGPDIQVTQLRNDEYVIEEAA